MILYNRYYKKNTIESFETILCPICDSNNYMTITNKGQFKIYIHLSICTNCGFIFLNPRWKKDCYDNFYKNDYDKMYRKKLNFESYHLEETIYHRIKKYAAIEFNNMLDIGAGKGKLISFFNKKEAFLKSYSIEPSPNNLLMDISIYMTNDVENDWDKNYADYFDFINMRHVLEHLLNIDVILKKVFKTLKKDGACYISVPDIYNYKGSLTKYWFRVPHVYYFTQYHLERLMTKYGFKPIVIMNSENEIWGIFKKEIHQIENINLFKDNLFFLKKEIKKDQYFYLLKALFLKIKAILRK